MSRQIHITRTNELITSVPVQLRADDPSLPVDLFDGNLWWNSTEGLLKARINGVTKVFPFDVAGQSLYSTTVSSTSDLLGAISAGIANTIYLRAGSYDLTSIANPGLVIQKSTRFIGEKQKGASGTKVRIITDPTHFINVAPANPTITNNNTITVTNNNTSVTLVGGIWSTVLTGQYLFMEGQIYLIAANPTNTTLTLDRAYTGTSGTKSYFITSMLDGVSFENIEFVAQTTTHDAIIFQNIIRPVFVDCSFTASDAIYGRAKFTITYNPFIVKSDFLNYKVNFISDNYNGIIVSNNFITSVLMATDPAITIDTQKGTGSIDTFFNVSGNKQSGPGSFLKLVSANSNTIAENTGNTTNNLWLFVDSNSHNNEIIANRGLVASGGDVPLRISSSGNIVNSNRFTKAAGFAIDLTATARSNTLIGNRIDGGATINDTVSANANRIEDDLSRIGQPPTGTSKDQIDIINGLLVTLQNVPSSLIQKGAAVNSGVVTESPVFWNSSVSEYQLADTSNTSKDALVGIVKKSGSNSGDVYLAGLVEFTNSGNLLVNPLFNSGFIGQNFYVGASGQLIAESQLFTASGSVPTNPVILGRLIDIPGGVKADLFINVIEDQKYGTNVSQWYIGSGDASEKKIITRSVAGDNVSITYSPSAGLFYAVYNGNSGEIVQPLNSKVMVNSVFDYNSGILVQVTSGSATVSAHTAYISGFKKSTAISSVSPVSNYSGSVYIFDHVTSGVIISSGFVSNAVFLGSIYNSGSQFLTWALAPAYSNVSTQSAPGTITPPTTSYFELARAHIPGSGTVDFIASASVLANVQLQPALPFQIARIKMQLDGSDIAGSEMLASFSAVSGQVLYQPMSTEKLVSVFSQTGTVHEVKLLGTYDLPASTTPVTFSGINLILKRT